MKATTMRDAVIFCAVVSLLFGRSAQAVSVVIPNNSFEAETDCCNNSYTLTGWVTQGSGATGVQNQFPNNPVGTSGTNWAFLNIDGPGGNGAIADLVSPVVIAPNTVYTLTVALGNNNEGFGGGGYGRPADDQINLASGSTTSIFTASPVLIASTNVPAFINGALNSSDTGSTIPNNSFVDYSVTYHSGANSFVDPFVGTNLFIALTATYPTDNTAGGGFQSLFDNVRLTAVPEPSSFILAGLGAIGLFAVARRRRKA